MGKLGNISGKDTVKAFLKAGWQPLGQVGSHLVMVKPGIRVNLSVSSTQRAFSRHTSRLDSQFRFDRGRIPEITLMYEQPTHVEAQAKNRLIIVESTSMSKITTKPFQLLPYRKRG